MLLPRFFGRIDVEAGAGTCIVIRKEIVGIKLERERNTAPGGLTKVPVLVLALDLGAAGRRVGEDERDTWA